MEDRTKKTAALYAMLEARRIELGLSQLQLGQLAFGRPDTSAMQNLRRGSSPTFDRLGQICEALDLELYVGPRRSDVPVGAYFAEDTNKLEFTETSALRAGFLPIPWHRSARQAGVSPLALLASWLDERNLMPETLSVVAPDSCHIEHDADIRSILAVIDETAKRTASPRVWAFLERGKVLIARIQIRKEALLIHDSDPAVGVRLIDGVQREAIALLGAVVWIGQPVTN